MEEWLKTADKAVERRDSFGFEGALNEYVTYNLQHMLVVKWMAAGGVVLVILGLMVAAVCQKKIA